MTVMEDVYYFTLISGGKLARDHLGICLKYLGEKPRSRMGAEGPNKIHRKIMMFKIVQ